MKANRGKCLALAAVLAMVVCAFAVALPAESDEAVSTTYISGGIQENYTVTSGMVVVVNGDLKIDKSLAFTVKAGATLTINEGVTVTVDGLGTESTEKAKFVVEDGARVIINGDLVVGQYGEAAIGSTPANDNEAAETAETADEFYAGTFVYGSVTAQKGGELDIEAEVMNGGSVVVSSTNKYVSTIGGFLILMPGAAVGIDGFVAQESKTASMDKIDAGYGLIVAAYGADFSKALGSNVYLGAVMGITGDKATYNAKGYPEISAVSLDFSVTSESATVYAKSEETVTKTTAVAASLAVEGEVANAHLSILVAEDIADDEGTNYYTDKACKNAAELKSANIVAGELSVTKTGSLVVDADLTVSGELAVAAGEDDNANNLSITGGTMTVSGAVITYEDSYTVPAEEEAVAAETEKVVAGLKIAGGTFTIIQKEGRVAIDIFDIFDEFQGAYYVVEENLLTDSMLVACELSVAIAAADGETVTNVVVSGATGTDAKKAGYAVTESFTLPAKVTLTVYNGLVIGKDFVVTIAEDAIVEFEEGKIYVDGKLIDVMGETDENSIVADVIFSEDEDKQVIYTSLTIAISELGSGTISLKDAATVSEDMTVPADITVDLNGKTMTVAKGKTLTVDGVIDASADNSKLITADKTAKVVVNTYVIVADETKYVEEASEKGATGFNVSGIYATAAIEGIKGTHFVMSVPYYEAHVADVTVGEVQGTVSYTGDVALTGSADDLKTLSIAEGSSFTVTGTITISYFTIDADGELTAKVANSVGTLSLTAISGILVSDVVSEDDGASLQISGTVAGEKAAMALASGKLTITGDFDASALGTFSVASATELIVSSNDDVEVKALDVEGTLTVSAGTLTVSKDLVVLGTAAVAKDAKLAVEGNAYVGMSAPASTGAAATVSGEGDLTVSGLIYIAAGSSVDESMIKDLKSTKFVSEDAEVYTVYGTEGTAITAVKPAVTNAKFLGWYDSSDDSKAVLSEIKVGTNATVIAKIQYDIYAVTVIGDNGVGTVAIDGYVLAKNSNVFTIDNLIAGSHTIAVEQKYGYSGTLVIKVNGTAITGNTFTLSGTSDDDTAVSIDISGSVPDSTEPVVPEKDNGMKITDYLLIVLVVLIVIMAIMVAMRMMRS